MLYITKVKSITNKNKTVHSMVHTLLNTINTQIDSIIEYSKFEKKFIDTVFDVNNYIRIILDGNTICQHHLVVIVNKLWTIVNRFGMEIRSVQGSNPDLVIYNIIFTKIQNYYFKIFVEFNHMIRLEIRELKKFEFTDEEIEKISTIPYTNPSCAQLNSELTEAFTNLQDSEISIVCSICVNEQGQMTRQNSHASTFQHSRQGSRHNSRPSTPRQSFMERKPSYTTAAAAAAAAAAATSSGAISPSGITPIISHLSSSPSVSPSLLKRKKIVPESSNLYSIHEVSGSSAIGGNDTSEKKEHKSNNAVEVDPTISMSRKELMNKVKIHLQNSDFVDEFMNNAETSETVKPKYNGSIKFKDCMIM